MTSAVSSTAGVLPACSPAITGLVERQPCSVLVIDSFRALRYQSRDEAEFEGFIQ